MEDPRSAVRGRGALPVFGVAAALLLATTATAQQGPPHGPPPGGPPPGGAQQGPLGGPPPNRSTAIQSGELRETWNDRVSLGEQSHVLGLTPTTYGYDPRSDRWTRLPDLPIAMHGLKGSAVIDGRIVLPGGGITLGGNSGTNAVQVYRPAMSCQ